MEIVFNSDIILIFARNNSGKTNLIKWLIKDIPKEDVFILDVSNQFKTYPNRLFPLNHSVEVLDNFILKCRLVDNKLIVIDDGDVFDLNRSRNLNELLITQRHQNLGVIFSTRRLIGLKKTAIQNAKYLIFSSNLPLEDKEYINKSIGKINWEVVDRLPEFSFMVFDTHSRTYSIIKPELMNY